MDPNLTRTSPAPGLISPSPRAARFVTGTVLAGRYRIVNLLGTGGMGEVYKADDLKLEHAVALKFLPETLALSPAALARFHGEVRIARQVSHPSVCRVYDIGEIDGLHFLTMEFIDGEDLASLLRRIGRLPPDKAVEVARQLCAGLAAAHDAGVLHRDLKPHNVMIDGRGRARITDFGIAAIARDVRQEHTVVGTPAYMAPELLRGEDATVRSDIYALGLVLYEVFTGKRAIEATTIADAVLHHSSGSVVTTPSALIRDVDPLVERVIVRCLERDPAARPASAIQVAAALPGGDPLQAALAAGETPSPEMVAAAGSHEAMPPKVAIGLAAAIAVVILFLAIGGQRSSLLGRMSDEASPDVLRFRAREMLTTLGYGDRGRDQASGFLRDTAYVTYDLNHHPAGGRIERLALGRPAVLQFWYRESPSPLLPHLVTGPPTLPPVTLDNPPHAERGMRYLQLDLKGRLIEFGAIPPGTDDTTHSVTPIDWNVVFQLAGLDRHAFQPVSPSWAPLAACDERAAWIGVYPEQPDVPLRLEAAAYRGRLVGVRTIAPWSSDAVTSQWVELVLSVLGVVLYLVAAGLAWYNVRMGRGDTRAAVRLGAGLILLSLTAWAAGSHHLAGGEEALHLRVELSQALFGGVTICLAYLAIEPHVRRRWPVVLVSWSRLLAGRWRDPLVGRDALIGVALGVVVGVTTLVVTLATSHTTDADADTINTALSLGTMVRAMLAVLIAGIAIAILFTLLMLVLRALVRVPIIAGAILVLLFVIAAGGNGVVGMALGAVTGALAVFTLTRFGLVALVAYFLAFRSGVLLWVGLAWGGGTGVFFIAILLAFIAAAAYLAMGSPRLGAMATAKAR